MVMLYRLSKTSLPPIERIWEKSWLKPQSMATTKHKFQLLVFNPANQKLIDFLDELQKLAKDAFRVAAQAIIEQFIYAKMPPHLKKSINQAHLENGTYEQIVSHLEKELELIGLETPDEMPINTVTQQPPQQNSDKPRPTCYHCKKPGHYQNQCPQLKQEKHQTRNNTNSANNNNGSAQTNSNPNNNKVTNNTKGNNINNHRDRKSRPVFPPCETCGRNNHSTEKCYLGANAAKRPPPRKRQAEGQNQGQQKNAQINSDGIVQAAACSPSFKLKTPRLHSAAARDTPETNEIFKLLPIPEVVWQQPTENVTNQDNLNITTNDSTLKTNVASQTSPPKGTQPQNHVDTTEQPSGNQTGNEPVSFLDSSKNSSTNTQSTEQHVVTTPNGDTTNPPLTTATPLIAEGLVRDEQTNEVYLPLTSTVVLKRKQEMLYVPLDFENYLTVDALVDSAAIVTAIAQDDLEKIKQKAPNNILKIDDPPSFHIQVANGQLEKPLSRATLNIEIGDKSFAEHFVVMQKLTGPINGLHFMKNNSVVNDTTHGLIHFPHLTMQVKTTSSKTTNKPQPIITDEALIIPPTTTRTIRAFTDHPSKWRTRGIVTPLEKFTETASLLISYSLSTIIDKRKQSEWPKPQNHHISSKNTNRLQNSPWLLRSSPSTSNQ